MAVCEKQIAIEMLNAELAKKIKEYQECFARGDYKPLNELIKDINKVEANLKFFKYSLSKPQ